MKRYSNPADYLIRMVQAPHKCSDDLSVPLMVAKYQEVLAPRILDQMNARSDRYSSVKTDFKALSELRRSNWWVQYREVFVRNWKYTIRNRKAFAAIFINSILISLMMLSVYFQVGDFPTDLLPSLQKGDFE